MSIRTKLTIASTGFFFPIGVLLFFFVTTRNEKITFAQKELEGSAHLAQIQPLVRDIFLHSLLANRVANTANVLPTLSAEFRAAGDSIDNTLKNLIEVANHGGTQLLNSNETRVKITTLAGDWQALKSNLHVPDHFSAAESNDAHTKLIAQLRDVILHIGDQSNLILDPDLDSYYLMDLTLLQTPEREHLIYQIMMLGERIITNGRRSEEEKFLLTTYLTLLRSSLSKCRSDYHTAFANNPAQNLSPALQKLSEQNLTALQEFARFTETNLVHPNTIVLRLPELLAAYNGAMQTSNAMWAMDTKCLNELLSSRIGNTQKELYTNVGIVILVLFIAATFAGLILRNVLRSIGELSFAATKVSNGDLSTRVIPRNSDELSSLGQTFNAMVESLQTLFIEVEQEQKESARLAQKALQEIVEHEKTATELLQEKEKAEQYLRVAEVIFVAFDTKARITLLNRKGYEILEYEEGELIGKDWFRVCIPPEEYDAVSQVYQKMISEEAQPFEYYENQILTKTGKKRHIAWHNSVLRDESGTIIGTFSSGEDITERKQAEEALRASEERFRTLSEVSFEGIIIHENGIIRNANQAFANLFSLPNPEYLIGKNGFDVLSLTPKSLEIIREQARTGSNLAREIDVVRPDGSIFPAVQQGREVFYEGRKMRVVIMRDITERKNAENALKKLIMMSDTALQLTQAGYWHSRLDDSGLYESSAQTVAIFGDIPNPEFRYHIMDDWFANVLAGDEEYARATLQNYQDAVAGKVEMYDSIYAYKRPVDGRTVWIHALGTVVRNEDGIATDMYGVSQDITEFKLAEERISELNRTLEQRVLLRTNELENTNKELEAFSYSVSHDLRAPLRGIDGWSLALMEDYGEQLEPTARQYLDRVRSETQRMGQLIEDMLRLSVITRAEMKWTTVNLSELASTILERLQEASPDRQFTFIIQPELVVSGDTNLLEIMLTNLLGNACKFTSKKSEAVIEFGKGIADEKNVYFIRDNGAGFNKESAKKLFGAFQRMHKQSEFPGTGVGLATVQRIINRHQGNIWVDAAIDKGATFYFTLGTNLVLQEQHSL
jgi:PAS domain S-box-containing protein